MLDDSPHFGLPVTAYDIDGQHITTVHAPWSDSRQFNYVHFEKTDLYPGDHTLIVTNMNGTSPTIFWLDYFLVDSSSLSSAVPPTVPTSHGSLPSSQRPQSSSPSPNPPTTGSSSPPESTSSASSSVSSSTSTSTSTSPSPNTESGSSSSNSSSSLIPVDSQKPGLSSLSSTSSQPISTSVESAASTSTSSNSGIIGGVVGGIASIALIAFILFFWRRHRLKREAGIYPPFPCSPFQVLPLTFPQISGVTSHKRHPLSQGRRSQVRTRIGITAAAATRVSTRARTTSAVHRARTPPPGARIS